MKEQDNQDLLVENVDANAVDALSTELLETVSVEGASEEQLDELLLDDKKKEEEEQEGVLSKIAEEGVEVAAAEGGMIDLAEIDTNEQGGGAGSSGGSMAINPAVAVGLGVAGVVGVAAAADDGGSSGGGNKNDGPKGTNQKFDMTVTAGAPVVESDVTSQAQYKLMTFTLQLDGAPKGQVEAFVTASSGSAEQNVDFELVSDKVVFAAGQSTATVQVKIFGDELPEGNEDIVLTVSSKNLNEPASGVGTIVDNDGFASGSNIWILQETPDTPVFVPGTTGSGLTWDGIPVDLALQFLQDVSAIDIFELGLIDDDGVFDGDANGVVNVTVSPSSSADDQSASGNNDNNDGNDDSQVGSATGGSVISIELEDGTVLTTEADLGIEYLEYLRDIMFKFDPNTGNPTYETRLEFEGDTDPSFEFEDNGPIVLTPALNNGGSSNPDVTGAGDDLIIAGRVELVHEAYIDGGAGYNTLEIDGKGIYAQALALLNIQEIQIQNLPNVYTGEEIGDFGDDDIDTVAGENQYPDLAANPDFAKTVVDLSRAIDIERLVLTEGNGTGVVSNDGSEGGAVLGDLTVVGVRNGATVSLEGGFSEPVNVHYGQGLSDSINIDLRLGDITENGAINLLHNLDVITVNSLGIENHMEDFFAGGNISRMYVTGDAVFSVEDSLHDSFNVTRPALIDASENTAGVDLSLVTQASAQGGSAAGAVNLMMVIDNSSSLGSAVQDEIDAANALLDAYEQAGVATAVRIVTFSPAASNFNGSAEAWLSIADARNVINALNASGSTNFDGALTAAIDAWDGVGTSGTQTDTSLFNANGDNQVVFLSDGQSGVSSATQTNWETFLDSNDITANAFGFGSAQVSNLEPVAYDGETSTQLTPTVVANNSDLADALINITGAGAISQASGDGVREVRFIGTSGDDDVNFVLADSVEGATKITVEGNEGDNEYTLSANVVKVEAEDGNNIVHVGALAGEGAYSLARDLDYAEIELGNGNNTVEAVAYVGGLDAPNPSPNASGNEVTQSEVRITTGDGNNDINAWGDIIHVNTGDGDDEINATGLEITIDSDGGDDRVTLFGINDDFQGSSEKLILAAEAIAAIEDGVLLDVDLGSGSNTLVLGDQVESILQPVGSITALTGSSISGSNITLFVKESSDIREADISGADFDRVLLDDDSGNDFNNAQLTLTADQFSDIGAAAFDVEFASFGAIAHLKIIVEDDVTLSDLVNLDELSDNVCLNFELYNDATLTLSAQELNDYVATDGITAFTGFNGNVVVTDAGQNFNAFQDTTGGLAVGSINGTYFTTDDIVIERSEDGFERPTPDANEDQLIVTNDDLANPLVVGPIDISDNGSQTDLILNGGGEFVFTSPVLLPPNFTLDFSEAGAVSGLTIGNFHHITEGQLAADGGLDNMDTLAPWGQIIGNDLDGQRIDIQLENGGIVGDASDPINGGFHSSGVEVYVVTDVYDTEEDFDGNGFDVPTGLNPALVAKDGDALTEAVSIALCDTTEDVEVVGVQMNWNTYVEFLNLNFHHQLLLEGDGAVDWTGQPKENGNPDFSNIGYVRGMYFADGEGNAPAVVEINNQGVALGVTSTGAPRPIRVQGLDLDGATSADINIADGNAQIDILTGDTLDDVTFTSAFDVSVTVCDVNVDMNSMLSLDDLDSINAADVAGEFTLVVDGTMSDFSGVDLSGVDTLVVAENVTITLTADQIVALGFENIVAEAGTELNVVGLDTQVVDLSEALTVSGFGKVGDVTLTDVDGTLVLDPATSLHSADKVTILAVTSDTTAEMTAEQFNDIAGSAPTVDALVGQDILSGNNFVPKLVITDLDSDTVIDFANVTGDAEGTITPQNGMIVECVRLDGVVADDDFAIVNGSATLLAESGVNDLSGTDNVFVEGEASGIAMASPGLAGVIAVELTGGELTLTAGQLAQILAANLAAGGTGLIEDVFAGSNGGVLNITEYNGQAFDLDELEALGIDIGTITLLDSNAAINVAGGATFGGADEIVGPTADENNANGNDQPDGIEPTTFNLSVAQYLSMSGIISGDATVNLMNLVNNNDSDGDFTLDNALVDVSGITAPQGTISLGEDTVTLNELTSLGDFEILLANGQMIQFSTQVQADGTTVTEISGVSAIAWLFDTVSGQVETSFYDENIDTLFILEDLVDGVNEEDLWTTLADSIVVEKVNVNGIPDVLIGFDRVNTFEALTAIAGVTYDDTDEFESVQTLTINLEGNTDIGDVLIADTNGEAAFHTLTINSYEDRSTLDSDNGFGFQPNVVGNITIADTADAPVSVVLNTYDDVDNVIGTGDDASGFLDTENVNGGPFERDGLDLEVGVITFEAEPGQPVSMTLTGANDIDIGGLDITDPDITLLTVGATNHTGDLTIGGINPLGGLNPFDNLFVVDGHTALPGDIMPAGQNLLVVTGGTNDFTAQTGGFDVDAVHFTADSDLWLTADQIELIMTPDVNGDFIADNWTVEAGANVNLHVTGLDADNGPILFNLIEGAGINIGDIYIANNNEANVIDPGTHFGNADSIITPTAGADDLVPGTEGTSLYINQTQFGQVDGGTITGGGEVNIYGLTDEDAAGNQSPLDIDLSNVTAPNGSLFLGIVAEGAGSAANPAIPGTTPQLFLTPLGAAGGNDLEFADTALLNEFAITLNDIESTPATADEIGFGEIVRLATGGQAERAIIILGGDGAPGGPGSGSSLERDTSVIWLFDSISGTDTAGVVDTSNYDDELGRLWLSNLLVDGVNVEDLYTSLDGDIIVRVYDPATLDELIFTTPFNRTVEVEAYTDIPGGFTWNDVDGASGPFDFIQNFTLVLGGETNIGDFYIDNVLAAAVDNDDEFEILYILSRLADGDPEADYLLPQDQQFVSQGGAVPNPDDPNVIGDIGSGMARDEMSHIVIDTGTAAAGGGDLIVGTVFLSDDDGDDPLSTIELHGDGNVEFKAIDATDAETNFIAIDVYGSGTYNITGGSPGVRGGATTDGVTITDDGITSAAGAFAGEMPAGGSTILFGLLPGTDAADITAITSLSDYFALLNLDGSNVPYSAFAGEDLNYIDLSSYNGTFVSGVVGQVQGNQEDFDPFLPGDEHAFNFTGGSGFNLITFGPANVDGTTMAPELEADGVWLFDFSAGVGMGGGLILQEGVTFGAGTFSIDGNLGIDGNVDITGLLPSAGVDGFNFNPAQAVTLFDDALFEMTDEQWLDSGVSTANFYDEAGDPPVLNITADLIADYGNDFTLVRGYAEIDIDPGLSVILREDQADIAYVDGDDANPGVLTGANVTVYVQEQDTNGDGLPDDDEFGDRDISNLVGVSALVLEEDITDNNDGDNATLPNDYGYFVTMRVDQADSLIGNVTVNNNFISGLAGFTLDGMTGDGNLVDLTDPVGDGSVPEYDLSLLDELVLQDEDGTILSLQQLNDIGPGNIVKEDGSEPGVSLVVSGDITGTDLTGVENLILEGDTTMTQAQSDAILTLGGTITEDADGPYTLDVEDARDADLANDDLTGPAAVPDGLVDPNATITIDMSHVTVGTVNVELNTNTVDPSDGVTVVDGNFTVDGDLNGSNLVLSGDGTVTSDVAVVDGGSVTGSAASTLNLTDATNLLNGPDPVPGNDNDALNFAGVDASIAGTITLGGTAHLDPASELGAFAVEIGANNFTGTVSQLDGLTVTGTGNVNALDLAEDPVDLSGVAATGTLTAYLLDDGSTTTITLNAATNLGIFGVINSGATVEVLNLTAAQASGTNIVDGGALIEDTDAQPVTNGDTYEAGVVVTDLEDALDADLSLITDAAYDTDVQLDSTGNVQLQAGSDFSGINGVNNAQLTITGNGFVTVQDESAPAAGDGANVADTLFVVGSGATLVTDYENNDSNSIAATGVNGDVVGPGSHRILLESNVMLNLDTDVRRTDLVFDSDDDNVEVFGFEPDFFIYDAGGLDLIGRHTVDLDATLANGGATFETIADIAADNTTDVVISAGTGLAVVESDLTTVDDAGIAAMFADGAGNTDLNFNAAGDSIFLAVDNGTNTYLFLLQEGTGDVEWTAASADTATLVATFDSFGDATALTADQFVDYT